MQLICKPIRSVVSHPRWSDPRSMRSEHCRSGPHGQLQDLRLRAAQLPQGGGGRDSRSSRCSKGGGDICCCSMARHGQDSPAAAAAPWLLSLALVMLRSSTGREEGRHDSRQNHHVVPGSASLLMWAETGNPLTRIHNNKSSTWCQGGVVWKVERAGSPALLLLPGQAGAGRANPVVAAAPSPWPGNMHIYHHHCNYLACIKLLRNVSNVPLHQSLLCLHLCHGNFHARNFG